MNDKPIHEGRGAEVGAIFNDDVVGRLKLIYEELMWLAGRKSVTSRNARAWYSAVRAESLKTKVRRFSGKVSTAAVRDVEGPLVLEHFARLQASLSELIEDHKSNGRNDPEDFIKLIEKYEIVNITTDKENYAIKKHGGCYASADVQLLEWGSICPKKRSRLWERKLRGRVSNAKDFEE